jgi:dephospho-CoA kinase
LSLLIGLTGGMGSGKSTVAEILKKKGAYILNADLICRELVEPGKPALQEIQDRFGKKVIQQDGQLDRSELSRIVFDDPSKKKVLEDILHPKVFEEEQIRYEALCKKEGPVLVFVDAALLIESGNYRNMDKNIVVMCSDEERIHRLLKRDTLTEAEILKRIKSQAPLSEKIKFADYVVDNNHDLQSLELEVDKVYTKLVEILKSKSKT